MAELADALDSGSSEHYAHASSSLVIRTISSVHNVYEVMNTRFFCLVIAFSLEIIYNSDTHHSFIWLFVNCWGVNSPIC